MDVLDEAKKVLLALADIDRRKGRNPIDGESLVGPTGLTPDAINDAIETLENNSCIRVLRTNGTAPYDFLTVELNARGRMEAKELEHAASSPPSAPPVRQLPVPQLSVPSLDFISDPEIQLLVRRDWIEVQRCVATECWKAAMIMAGSATEGLLLDAIRSRQATIEPPKGDESQWKLDDMIRVAAKYNWLSPTTQPLHEFARSCRNLIHPQRELRERKTIDRHEAVISAQILETVIRDLRAHSAQVPPAP
jgi:hypothetical protein